VASSQFPPQSRDAAWRALLVPGRLEGLGALLAAGIVLMWLSAPIVEDSLFWWVPKGLLAAEQGPSLVLAHTLPVEVSAGLSPDTTPPQWAAGLPDYAHPPLWYWWLGAWMWAFGASVQTVHLACLPIAAAIGAGLVALARRLDAPLAGLAPLALPPLVAQLLRPELDLPLLASVVWALVALLDGRWLGFAVLGGLATWTKEPGVLLCVPAVLRVGTTRELRALPFALVPLLALGAWGLAHGGLASAERLPETFGVWLREDVPAALRLVVWEQGRWLLVLGLAATLWRMPRRLVGPTLWLVGLVAVWVVFFSVVGFRLQPHNPEPLTHVRYFVPGVALFTLLAAVRWPWLAVVGLLFLHSRSPFGPEASLFGVDAGRAEAASAHWIRAQVDDGKTVWVGSYHMAALSQTWAGHGTEGAAGVRMYSAETDPSDLSPGDLVVLAAYGEPAGPIHRSWTLTGVRQWTAGDATVVASEVTAPRER
jgi:hypothetical protein